MNEEEVLSKDPRETELHRALGKLQEPLLFQFLFQTQNPGGRKSAEDPGTGMAAEVGWKKQYELM